MNLNKVPTLEHIVLVKTASLLWNRIYIGDTIYSPLIVWQSVENAKIKQIQSLHLPKSLKSKLVDIIRPVGLRIEIWRRTNIYFSRNTKFFKVSLRKLCWTPLGIVDKKKTAMLLVREESLDLVKRYEFACIYCLESDILALWKRMSEDIRESLYNRPDQEFHQSLMVMFWTSEMIGGKDIWKIYSETPESRSDSMAHFFIYAVKEGNKAGAEYFLKKLRDEDRGQSFVCALHQVAPNFSEEYGDIFRYLLSEMNEEQRVHALKICSFEILKSFLLWPYQELFLEAMKHTWSYLSNEMYCSLLSIILKDRIVAGRRDYDYKALFREFWQQTPPNIKHNAKLYIFSSYWNPISNLLVIEDRENILLILDDCTVIERERISFNIMGWVEAIFSEKWEMIKFFLTMCILSKDTMIKFRKKVKQSVCAHLIFRKSEHVWTNFLKLLDELIESMDSECLPNTK